MKRLKTVLAYVRPHTYGQPGNDYIIARTRKGRGSVEVAEQDGWGHVSSRTVFFKTTREAVAYAAELRAREDLAARRAAEADEPEPELFEARTVPHGELGDLARHVRDQVTAALEAACCD